MKKYLEIFKYSIKQKLTFIIEYVVGLLSYGILMFVLNQLWDYILKDKLAGGFSKNQLVWYIIITELVTLSNYRSFHEISSMVKNGDIANLLIKPVDFIKLRFMQDLSAVIKLGINTLFAIVLGLVLAGPIKVKLINLILMIVSVILGFITKILISIFVGLIAMVTEENRGYWLVIQKLSFLLVLTPLEFYNKNIQVIFYLLPTTYLVYSPARIFIGASTIHSLILILLELIAMMVWYMGIKMIYKEGVKRINVNGG